MGIVDGADHKAFRVGVFSTLTNSYALVAVGASENFYRYVAAHEPLSDAHDPPS